MNIQLLFTQKILYIEKIVCNTYFADKTVINYSHSSKIIFSES